MTTSREHRRARLGWLGLQRWLRVVHQAFRNHELQYLLRNWGLPDWSERLPVQRRRPALAESRKVLWRTVAFVRLEAVGGKDRVPFADHAVTLDFGKDGRGGDRHRQSIAVNDGMLRNIEIEFHGINEQVVRRGTELGHRLVHRNFRRLVNVDLINARGVR